MNSVPAMEKVYSSDDAGMVMSEKVQALASSIYEEFQRIINQYDEGVVKNLMPLVVNLLENLDYLHTENQEHEVELELLREDNEQLMNQYEREKQFRKAAEIKLLAIEDAVEEERKILTGKIESMESIVRIFELKSKNMGDHVSRLEEKDNETKREYSKLHERYTELFKTHMDHLERTRILMGNDRIEQFSMNAPRQKPSNLGRSSGPVSFGFSSLDPNQKNLSSPMVDFGSMTTPSLGFPGPTLDAEFKSVQTSEENGELILEDRPSPKKIWVRTPSMDDPEFSDEIPIENSPKRETPSNERAKNEKRSNNTLYQEISFHDESMAENDDSEITGNWVHPGEYASSTSDTFFGMGKEVENLISENNELLATKNALNIVKDDLITKLDELNGEHEILRDEIRLLTAVKSRMKVKVDELEDEIKKLRDEVEKNKGTKSDDEEDVPMSQRKKFTRIEMARVLMERNQYKERFMELQEAVRWSEMVRASRVDSDLDKKGKQISIWKFFSNLFSTTNERQLNQRVNANQLIRFEPKRKVTVDPKSDSPQRKIERDKARPQRHEGGRVQAYGWSLPADNQPSVQPEKSNHLPVPVPIYCRPLVDSEPGTEVWCAAGVDLSGGKTADGGAIVGGSVFYANENAENVENGKAKQNSLVWICSSTETVSKVTIINGSSPADVVASFHVSTSQVFSIASVPGATELDYPCPEEKMREPCRRLSGSSDSGVSHLGSEEKLVCSLTRVKDGQAPPIDLPDPELDGDSIESPVILTSALPTMWLGTQSGAIFIHSAVAQWQKVCLAVQLKDSVLAILHLHGRVLAALANGTIVIFSRGHDGEWDLSDYYVVDLENQNVSVRAMCAVNGKVWCSFGNRIFVLDPRTLNIDTSFEAHPRKESQIRQMACLGDGVWISIRLDSSLRLFHAMTHQHLQDIDIEPYVSKMLEVVPGGAGKLGFSFVRITSLLIAANRLWMGTGNGVIISVPISEGLPTNLIQRGVHLPAVPRPPGWASRLSGTFIPFCSMAHAQLSFHGHRNAVKFFVCVPGLNGEETQSNAQTDLVISGGEGYIDFRSGDECDITEGKSKSYSSDQLSHLIVWQVHS